MSGKIIRAYLIFNWVYYFFFSLEFSIYVLFLKENGLTFTQIGIVNMAFMAAAFLLEIPTGIVADYFGRKFSVLLGIFSTGLGALIYFFSVKLWGFIAAEIMFAFGYCFISGALDAWVKDTLDFNGCNEKMAHVFSKGSIASRGGALVGGLVGGLIGMYSLRLPWIITAGGLFLATIFLGRIIKEEYFKKSEAIGARAALRKMKEICVDSVKYGYSNKTVWNLILLNTIFILGTQAFNMQWSPLFAEKIGMWSISWIYMLFSLFSILGIIAASRDLRKGCAEKKMLYISICLSGVAALGASFFENGYVILSFFLFHEIGRGAMSPVQTALIQENIPSSMRATIGSFNSMVGKLGAAVGWMGAGILADFLPIQMCWIISSGFFFLALIFVRKLKTKQSEMNSV
ncbi:MFS transporter [Patescibacteria group bacterium]|nr:MFS transporter [Patescibacteria group bacterium]